MQASDNSASWVHLALRQDGLPSPKRLPHCHICHQHHVLVSSFPCATHLVSSGWHCLSGKGFPPFKLESPKLYSSNFQAVPSFCTALYSYSLFASTEYLTLHIANHVHLFRHRSMVPHRGYDPPAQIVGWFRSAAYMPSHNRRVGRL